VIFTRRLERLVNSNVQTLREYLRSLFAPETKAVATMSDNTVGFSISMGRRGQRGYQKAKDMMEKEGRHDEDSPDSDDARLEDDTDDIGVHNDNKDNDSKDKG
jgi:hypothetical protein